MADNKQAVDAEVVKEDELDILRGKGLDSAQTPVELLKSGMALVKLENTTQMTIARATPRNEELVLKKCLAELQLYPDMAAEAVYVKPVGKNRQGVMQYVEGLSIRAAESLATRWGNCAYGAEPIADDGEVFTLGVVFLDYESNVRASRLLRISRKFKRRSGQIDTYSEDRFNSTVVPANQSKALREVILRALPSGLTKAYLKKAQKLMGKQFTSAQQKYYQQKLIGSFAEVNVSEDQIGEILGKPLNMGITENELVKLRGIFNALRDGETTLEQLLGSRDIAPAPSETSAEEALKAAQAASEETPKPETPPEPAKADQGKPKKPETPAKPAESKKKNLTPKQKLVKSLLPILKDGQAEFIKACQQGLGGKPDMNLEPETLLENFTQKDLEAISEALKNPQAQPAEEKKDTQTPDKPEEAVSEPKQQDLPPSEPPSEADPERAGLIKKIKEHDSALANKIAIVADVCGASFSDQALADMAENPELIEDIEKLRSVHNILVLMS